MIRRILVTGSRTWTDEQKMNEKLAAWFRPDAVLVSGHCPKGRKAEGADHMAERLWAHYLGMTVAKAIVRGHIEIHPADWKKHRKAAGFVRNGVMVNLGASACLAFACWCTDCVTPPGELEWPHYTHGTMDCAKKAKDAGIELIWTVQE